jgi:hypothetical protein
MFWTFKISFDVDILSCFLLGDFLGYFLKDWVIFFKPSGHPDLLPQSQMLNQGGSGRQ